MVKESCVCIQKINHYPGEERYHGKNSDKEFSLENAMNKPLWITSTQERTSQQPWLLPPVEPIWYISPSELASQTHDYSSISLKEMDSVALLNRTDTKFVLSNTQLITTLSALKDYYRILTIHGQRFNHYRTLYFDTPRFDLYNLHINNRAERYKVRSREYIDSDISFLEVKHRTRKNRTIKDRLPTERPITEITGDSEDWLRGVCPIDCSQLEPRLWNAFTRITLVNKQFCERVTLDVNLVFFTTNKVVQLNGIAVAEVKMDSLQKNSPFLSQMQLQRIHPKGFSKYCIGVAMLYDQVKKNSLKPKILWMNKIANGVVYE